MLWLIFTGNPANMTIVNAGKNGQLCINENEDVALDCIITQGDPIGKLQWVLDNEIMVWNYTDNLRLELRSKTLESGSVYRCEALNEEGGIVLTENVVLHINSKCMQNESPLLSILYNQCV